MYLLPSRKASAPFGWYSFYRPTEDRRLSRPGWLVTYRNKAPPRESNPDTVTHASTNRAQRRLWNGLVADNVAHAAGASILSLAGGVLAGMRIACGVRWAWRITDGLRHAFTTTSNRHLECMPHSRHIEIRRA